MSNGRSDKASTEWFALVVLSCKKKKPEYKFTRNPLTFLDLQTYPNSTIELIAWTLKTEETKNTFQNEMQDLMALNPDNSLKIIRKLTEDYKLNIVEKPINQVVIDVNYLFWPNPVDIL
jgi:hypothetical protein